MAISLTVNGQTYQYPQNRDSAGWGDQATAWAQAVTAALANTSSTGDIAPTAANVSNDTVGAFVNIPGLYFDPTQVRSAIVEFSVSRSTTTNEVNEVGNMYLTYNTLAATWQLAITGTGGSGLTFNVTSAGQLQYKCSAIAGTSYVGAIKFRARSFTV